jgi:UDP-MurNAc hydroxylase
MRATPIGHAGIYIETSAGSILCDPWFLPAFFGSWFVFPRNDHLPAELAEAIEHPDYLYISHLHGDHLDEAWLADHVSREATVLVPGFPTRELERQLRRLGFTKIVRTTDGEPTELGPGVSVAIHVETSITDGPGGDSALVVIDHGRVLVNQNDCRTTDLAALARHGRVDLHFLQFSGAIWYPMVYDETPQPMAELVAAKVEAQLTRALRYVEVIDARHVVPSAGPPCFLDDELFGFNVITGQECSIFPDQRVFLERLAGAGRHGIMNIPGTTIELLDEVDEVTVTHPATDDELQAMFADKAAYLRRYQADWADWLADHKAGWIAPRPDLVGRLAAWWEPLLEAAPTLAAAIGSGILIRSGDTEVYVDPAAAQVRAWAGEAYRYRFDITRELVETVTADQAVDWSNALFLSCRFRAWREGPFNEYVYNFFKSLSPERIRRAEAEARRKLDPPTDDGEIELCGYVMERYCPHRRADLSVFGEVESGLLTCTLHGWQFDLATGECLSSTDRKLRVRPAD